MVDFNKMRGEAKKELQSLIQQRTALDRKIVGLEQTIKGLDAVCSTDTDPALEKCSLDPLPLPPELNGLLSLGLTDAVRKLFENSGVMLLTPVSVRDQLAMYGYELTQDNPVAAIHAVFRRLEENMEIVQSTTEDDKKGYRWSHPLARVLAQEQMHGSGAAGIAALMAGRPTRETVIADLEAIERKRGVPKAPVPPPSMRKKLGL
jgi:hypothetical protein